MLANTYELIVLSNVSYLNPHDIIVVPKIKILGSDRRFLQLQNGTPRRKLTTKWNSII